MPKICMKLREKLSKSMFGDFKINVDQTEIGG